MNSLAAVSTEEQSLIADQSFGKSKKAFNIIIERLLNPRMKRLVMAGQI